MGAFGQQHEGSQQYSYPEVFMDARKSLSSLSLGHILILKCFQLRYPNLSLRISFTLYLKANPEIKLQILYLHLASLLSLLMQIVNTTIKNTLSKELWGTQGITIIFLWVRTRSTHANFLIQCKYQYLPSFIIPSPNWPSNEWECHLTTKKLTFV